MCSQKTFDQIDYNENINKAKNILYKDFIKLSRLKIKNY